jgi:hypothetical protein
VVPLQDEEALVGIENAVVLEQRDVDADEGSCVEVEEPDVAVQLGVARVEATALGKHHPAARVEAWVADAVATWGSGARSPGSADGTEANIVHQVDGQVTAKLSGESNHQAETARGKLMRLRRRWTAPTKVRPSCSSSKPLA